MKRDFYIKHSLMAMHDPRMKRLRQEETFKGVGIYWYAIEKLGMFPENRTHIDDFRLYCKEEKIPFSYFLRIVSEYDLFVIEEDGYFSPAELNPVQKRGRQTKLTGEKMERNGIVFEQKSIENKRKSTDTKRKSGENLPNSIENERKSVENERIIAKSEICKTLKNNDLSNDSDVLIAYTNNNKTATAAEEKEAAVADKKFAVEKVKLNAELPKVLMLRSAEANYVYDHLGEVQSVTRPIRPWREMVDELVQPSIWLETACMQSGYSALLMRNIEEAVRLFKQHIEAYDKGDNLLTMTDVHCYFTNFVRAGGRTSETLRQNLLAFERENSKTETPDLYRFEQLINGKRSYMGCPIPDDAPPRPDSTAVWDENNAVWLTDRNHALRHPK